MDALIIIFYGIMILSLYKMAISFTLHFGGARWMGLNHPRPLLAHFEPMTITVTHQIIRIPLEDRVDLEIEDRHNVHNRALQRTAIQTLEALQKSDQDQGTIIEALEAIDKAITNPKAKQALNQIGAMNAYYSTGKLREPEILRLVWSRINHPINRDRVAQLKENLEAQLADCVNGRDLHCCEGRVMRVLQTLQECDAEKLADLRPLWAFKEEIENKVIKYREKLLEKAPKEYNDLETKTELMEADQRLLDRFNRCLIRNLETRFKRDYLDRGLITRTELDDITQPYYEALG